MTREILLLRHGKSDWDASYGDDHDRPLARRGRKAAETVGRFLQRADLIPDLAVTSSALRARDTVVRATAAGDWGCPVEVTRDLYLCSAQDVVRLLQSLEDGVNRVLLAGHQPTWSQALSLLIGGGDHRFPTAALALVRVEAASWAGIRPGAGELQWLLPPRLLQRIL